LLFGSDEMKELLLRAQEDETVYDIAMAELFQSVRSYTLSKLRLGVRYGKDDLNNDSETAPKLNEDDCEDIVGEVLCNVLKSLDKFINNLKNESYCEAQRQAWLKAIVYNTISAFFRKRYRQYINPVDFKDYMDLNYMFITDHGSVDYITLDETLKKIVKIACGINSKPEKILTFLFNTIIFREISGHQKNGSAKLTVEFMNGKSMYDLRNALIQLTDMVYGVALTEDEIAPLTTAFGNEMPTEKGSTICEISMKTVADWSNRIKTHLFKYKDEIFGEEFKK